MGKKICCPQTFMEHPQQLKLKGLFHDLLVDPDPSQIEKEIVSLIENNPLVMDDFPILKGTYTRTILYKSENGFEAMVARWSSGAVSSIHGHPTYTLYSVAEGMLEIDNYKRCSDSDRVEKTNSGFLTSTEFFSFTGKTGTFDNNIHQVRAIEETLSIHISSDDSRKGEVFSQI